MLSKTALWLGWSFVLSSILAAGCAAFVAWLENSSWYYTVTFQLWALAWATIAVPAFVSFGVCILLGSGYPSSERRHRHTATAIRVAICVVPAVVVAYFLETTDYFATEKIIATTMVTFLCLMVAVNVPLLAIPRLRAPVTKCTELGGRQRQRHVLVFVASVYGFLWLITVVFGRPATGHALSQQFTQIYQLDGIERLTGSPVLGLTWVQPERPYMQVSKGLVTSPFLVIADVTVVGCSSVGSARYAHLWFFKSIWTSRPRWGSATDFTWFPGCAP